MDEHFNSAGFPTEVEQSKPETQRVEPQGMNTQDQNVSIPGTPGEAEQQAMLRESLTELNKVISAMIISDQPIPAHGIIVCIVEPGKPAMVDFTGDRNAIRYGMQQLVGGVGQMVKSELPAGDPALQLPEAVLGLRDLGVRFDKPASDLNPEQGNG